MPLLYAGGFISCIATTPLWQKSSNSDSASFLQPLIESIQNATTWLVSNEIVLYAGGGVLAFAGVLFFMLKPGSSSVGDILSSEAKVSNKPDAYREKIEETGVKLDGELTDISGFLESFISSNDRYADLLTKTNKALPKIQNPQQLKQIIRGLVAENQKFSDKTHELQENLENSKSQIEELRSDLSKAQEENMRDPLTGLGNRRMFDSLLLKEIEKSEKERSPLTLVMTDIDHFKKFNDNYGHQIGDEVLKVFGNIMESNTKGRDTVARYGGEEFGIILPETDSSSAFKVIEKMRQKLEVKKLKNSQTGETISRVTASFGIAQFRRGETREQLIERADDKLYDSKRKGRNQTSV